MTGSRKNDLNINKTFCIDPTHMTKLEAAITQQFLEQKLQQGNTWILAGLTYNNVVFTLPKSNTQYIHNLQFKYSLVSYQSTKHLAKKCFIVLGKTFLGNGATAEVNKAKGKLTWDNTRHLMYTSGKFKPETSDPQKMVYSKYVVKVETHSQSWTVERALSAYYLASRNKKLGIKYPTFFKAKNQSVTVMRRLKDYNIEELFALRNVAPLKYERIIKSTERWELYEILALKERGLFEFSMYDKLIYCREILKAYHEQVRDLNIIHGDIKTENIIIDFSGIIPQVTFFDYGHAYGANEKPPYRVYGTVGYIPPEVIEGEVVWPEKSELYSLGCVLAQLWGDDNPYSEAVDEVDYGYEQSLNRELMLFGDTPERIQDILYKMVSRHPFNRPTSDEVIAVFEGEISAYEASMGLGFTPPTTPR